MILMCDDQKDKARACPGYAPVPAGRPYPSELSHAERAVLEPLLPACPVRARTAASAPAPGNRGRDLSTQNRTGCAWRYLPKDFPPWRTVYGYFTAWRDSGVLQQLHDQLRDEARAAAGRDPQPTAAVIDSQSVKAAVTVPKASRGWITPRRSKPRRPARLGVPAA